jgi:transcriptional regulator with XRE-family HTH domain
MRMSNHLAGSATSANSPTKKGKRLTGGQWLARWRKKNGYASHQAAADALKVSRYTYRRWELGECAPGRDAALALSKKTGCPITIWAGRP